MSFVHIHKGLFKHTLAIAITASITPFAHAVTEQDEIQQLRAEVRELRALIQQQTATQQQITVPAVSKQSKDLKVVTSSGAEAKLYGFVRGDVSYQSAGGNSIFNRIHAVGLNGEHDDKLYSTVNTTRVGIDFKTPVAGADISGKVEVDFRNDGNSTDNNLRLRHAYLSYANWLIGQTTSSFSNLEVVPEMLDFNLNLGSAYTRTPMVRYSDKLTPTTQYFIGLEKGLESNRLPTLTAKVNHGFAEGKGLVTARALVEENRDGNNNAATATGWGVGAGASYKITPELKAGVDYMHVEGDNKFAMFTNTAYTADGTDLARNEYDALSLGATYQVNPKVRGTLGYGIMKAEDGNKYARLTPNANESLQQGWLNVMYAPVQPLTFGLEYVYGERETFAGDKGKDNRIGAMARYNF